MSKFLNRIICGDYIEVLRKYTVINHIDIAVKFDVGAIAAYQSRFSCSKASRLSAELEFGSGICEIKDKCCN